LIEKLFIAHYTRSIDISELAKIVLFLFPSLRKFIKLNNDNFDNNFRKLILLHYCKRYSDL